MPRVLAEDLALLLKLDSPVSLTEMQTQMSITQIINTDLPSPESIEQDLSGLTLEQLERNVDAFFKLEKVSGIARACHLREIRNREYPITGPTEKGGDTKTRMGWGAYLLKMGWPSAENVNREIKGLDALERMGRPTHLPTITSTALQEIGRAKPEVRSVVAEK